MQRSFLRDNGLTIGLAAIFALSFIGMALSGWRAHVEELSEHGAPAMPLLTYLSSGHYVSAVFENWESEFLQMASYVIFTAILFQRGSAESRDPDDPERDNDDLPPHARHWSRAARYLYAHSLGIALGGLFVLSFVLHWLGSWRAAVDEALLHHAELPTALGHVVSADFWFESFQNWQSEFLSTGVLVVLSIFLRFRGSPESKRVGATNAETGA